jgi:hypothetical protein
MGKYVSEKFKELNRTDYKSRNPGHKDILELIVAELRNENRWQKAVQHLREKGTLEDSPRDIGGLMKEVQTDIEAECEELIKKRLYDWAKKDILRGACKGIPEWYKSQLMEKQFDGNS